MSVSDSLLNHGSIVWGIVTTIELFVSLVMGIIGKPYPDIEKLKILIQDSIEADWFTSKNSVL